MRENEGREKNNVYDMKGNKVGENVHRRHSPAQVSTYKTGDTKRKDHSVNRRKRRRILRGCLFVFFVFAIIVSAIFGLSQVFCKVDTITVKYTNKAHDSKRYYTNKSIVQGSYIENGDNLLFVSSKDVSEKLEKNMPYISSVVVKKDFPSTVIIEVTECEKVYAYRGKSAFCLVDEKGKFIEMADGEKAKKYTMVTCSSVTAGNTGDRIEIGKMDEETKVYPDTEKVIEYLELVRKSGMKITSINIKDLNDISMEYDGRIDIHVGKMSDEANGVTAWRKLQLAKSALEKQDEISKTQTGKLELAITKKAYFTSDKDLPEEEKTTSTQ